MKIKYLFLMMTFIGLTAVAQECDVESDCRAGFSCRSKPYGGTQCVKRQISQDDATILNSSQVQNVQNQNSIIENSTATEEATCLKIGFKSKTEAFGNCVLELLGRKKAESSPSNEDERLCVGYGFKMGSENFASCKLQMVQARWQASQQQIQYEEQKRQYDAQMEFARNKARQESARRNLDMSLRLLNGQSPTEALLGAGSGVPIAPKAPLPQTIILPGGRAVTCVTQTNVTTCI